jgi:hypothetical protein
MSEVRVACYEEATTVHSHQTKQHTFKQTSWTDKLHSISGTGALLKSLVGFFRLDFILLTERIILDVCYEMWE